MSKNHKYNPTPDDRLDPYQHIMPGARCHTITLSSGAKAGVISASFPTEDSFVSAEIQSTKVSEGGTENKGFVEWGKDNQLPNRTVFAAKSSPYLAPAHKFNADVAYANGPQPMYSYVDYSNPFQPSAKQMPYRMAGNYLLNRMRTIIRQAEAEEAKAEQDASVTSDALNTMFGNRSGELTYRSPGDVIRYMEKCIKGDHPQAVEDDTEIESLARNYISWRQTMPELREFMEQSSIDLLFMNLCADFAHFQIVFPELIFNKGREYYTSKEERGIGELNGKWKQKITAIKHRKAICCRREEKDEQERSRYVYYSPKWAQEMGDNIVTAVNTEKQIALRSASPESVYEELNEIAAKNHKLKIASRTKSLVVPVMYPCVDKFYYPEPAYMSLFRSKVFEYAQRLIRNKAITADNDNMWGHIIYIHEEYKNKYLADRGAITPKERDKCMDELYREIDNFLSKDENKNKALTTFSLRLGESAHSVPAIRIEKVEKTESGADTKDELEEISSLIFFNTEIHTSIFGVNPGKSGRVGGTEARELFGLKNVRMIPVRRLLLLPFEIASRFNGWDEHLEWTVPYSTLTTLDASKSGVTEKADDTAK